MVEGALVGGPKAADDKYVDLRSGTLTLLNKKALFLGLQLILPQLINVSENKIHLEVNKLILQQNRLL
jgi:hypothetical protein